MADSFGGAKPKIKTPRRDSNVPDTVRNLGSEDCSRTPPVTTTSLQSNTPPAPKGNNSRCLRGDKSTKTTCASRIDRQSDLPLKHEAALSVDELFFKDDHYREEEVGSRNTNVGSCKRFRDTDRTFIKELLPLTDELIQNAIKGTCSSGLNGTLELKQLTSSSSRETDIDLPQKSGVCKKKRKELTPREKWKKSGFALRKYLSAKFGFGDVSSRKSHHPKSYSNGVPTSNNVECENVKPMEQYSDKTGQKGVISSSQTNPISRSSSTTSTGSDGKREKSLSFLKAFRLHKEKHKNHQKMPKLEVDQTKTDLSSSPSPVQDTDSDWPNRLDATNQNAQSKTRICNCDCDWSMTLDQKRKCTCDWSFRSHDRKGQQTNNLVQLKCENSSQANTKPHCKAKKGSKKVERSAQRKTLVGLLDDALKSSSDAESDSSRSVTCVKRRRRKSKDSPRVGSHVGVLEPGNQPQNQKLWTKVRINEACAGSQTRNKEAVSGEPTRSNDALPGNLTRFNEASTENQARSNEDGNQKRYNEDGNRNQARNNEADKKRRTRSFVLTGKPQNKPTTRLPDVKHKSPKSPRKGSDVLLGLKYALPYLPERLRNRLHSSSNEADQNYSLNSENKKSKRGVNICDLEEHVYTKTDRLTSCDNRSDEMNENSRDSVQENSLDRKSRSFKHFENGQEKFSSKQSNTKIKTEKDDDAKKEICDLKFHLNHSGTWTMTQLGDGGNSDSDLENGYDHGDGEGRSCYHDNMFWSPLTGQMEEMSPEKRAAWIKEDLVHLEASLEDPFNLRGDNLIATTTTHTNGFNSSRIKGDNLGLNNSFTKESNSLKLRDGDAISNSFSSHRIAGDVRYDNRARYDKNRENGREASNSTQVDMCSGLLDLVYGMEDSFVGDDACDKSHIDGFETWDDSLKQNNYSDEFIARNIAEIMGGNSEETDSDEESVNRSRSLFHLSDSDSISSSLSQRESRQIMNSTSEFSWDSFGVGIKDDDESMGSGKLTADVGQETCLIGRCDNSIDELCSGLLRMSPNDEVQSTQNILSHSSTLDDLDMPRSRSWNISTPESSLDADDEFECDCEHCLSLRYATFNQSNDLDMGGVARQPSVTLMANGLDDDLLDMDTDYLRIPESMDVGIGVSELRSLDILATESNLSQGLGVMLENVILQLLADNVIMQMVAVRPDLLSDQAAPPASQSVIDDIPTIRLSQEDLEQNPVCPVCLCSCVLDETMSRLPCQHIFHPICVQAWLVKSGTCPVCRYKMAP